MAVKWDTLSSLVLWASGATSALANSTVYATVSASLSNQTARDVYGWLEFTGAFAVAPNNSSPGLDVYSVPAQDGATFGDAIAATLAPQQEHLRLASIPVRKVTSAQRVSSGLFPLAPFLQRMYIDNRTGQTLSAGWEITLRYGSLVSS